MIVYMVRPNSLDKIIFIRFENKNLKMQENWCGILNGISGVLN